MAYRGVARRTNEIGLRMALAAGRRRLIWMVLREVCAVAVVAAIAAGYGPALRASRIDPWAALRNE